ncbi:HIT family protein [Nibrella saemangeumensis]|uniref:HIT family protein n=1 Tax=Nibrella saemangeumensis TaxID=1084526 RepID=A0ABP8N302_9BACT
MSVFDSVPESSVLYRDELFYIIKDKYPVSPGHVIIISVKSRIDFFALDDEEKQHMAKVIDLGKALIEKEYSPDGYNIGMNCGEAAGQTVMHFHCHLIPRYTGDMEDPRGGIRHCITRRGYYSADE